MTENMQARRMQSRQAVFVAVVPEKAVPTFGSVQLFMCMALRL
jgi:hypothetical protein